MGHIDCAAGTHKWCEETWKLRSEGLITVNQKNGKNLIAGAAVGAGNGHSALLVGGGALRGNTILSPFEAQGSHDLLRNS